ncbi:class I SAM-dependent methyltransferase [Actinoplanes rectilineatus]|uniref:class I SAM-dependent methyltransferase n=1 Tax=Actinoplanes rectilineatus TaxID=113571 RepID=UPI0005F2BA09|nr:methyltransferase domain-containing protein [Actinoplanes rectilineatus]
METSGSIAAGFDERAAGYDDDVWHVRYARRLVELARPGVGSRVLDAATGTGMAARAAALAAGPSGHVTGVDISDGMLHRARRHPPEAGAAPVELIRADASRLPHLPDRSFDLVLCSAGMLYLPVAAALAEWWRLLRPGGTVGFSTMRAGFPRIAGLFRGLAVAHGLVLDDPVAPLGTPQQCRRVLADAGFVPGEVIGGTVRFSRADAAKAWHAHTRGVHRAAFATLGPGPAHAFEQEFAAVLAERLAADEERLLTAEVLYAFGIRQLPDPGHRPGPQAVRRGC